MMRISQYLESSSPMFISHTRDSEDISLVRAFADVETGFYIDVGANDPVENSVTKALYDRGWSEINIEPAPKSFQALCEVRPRDINPSCVVGQANGMVPLFEIGDGRVWGSLTAGPAAHCASNGYRLTKNYASVLPLSEIRGRFVGDRVIRLLRIDANGFEADVHRGMDLSGWRPWIILITAVDRPSAEENRQLANDIVQCNYRALFFDGLNRFMLAEEHIELAERIGTPPSHDGSIRSSMAPVRPMSRDWKGRWPSSMTR